MNLPNRWPVFVMGATLLAVFVVIAVLAWPAAPPPSPGVAESLDEAGPIDFGVTLYFRVVRFDRAGKPHIPMAALVDRCRSLAASGGFKGLIWGASGTDEITVTVPMTSEEFAAFSAYASAMEDAIGGQPIAAGELAEALAARDVDRLSAFAAADSGRADDVARLVEAWVGGGKARSLVVEAGQRLDVAFETRMAAAPDAREEADALYVSRQKDVEARIAQREQAEYASRSAAGSLLWTGRRLERILLHVPADDLPRVFSTVAGSDSGRREKLLGLSRAYVRYAAVAVDAGTILRLASLLSGGNDLAFCVSPRTAAGDDSVAISPELAAAAVRDLAVQGPDHMVAGDGMLEGERLGWFPCRAVDVSYQAITGQYDGRYYVLLCVSRRRSMAMATDRWCVTKAEVKPASRGSGSHIHLKLDAAGRDAFRRITRDHVGHGLAIVINGEVHSIPIIRTEIVGDVRIDGANLPGYEAKRLAAGLAAALPTARLELQATDAFKTTYRR